MRHRHLSLIPPAGEAEPPGPGVVRSASELDQALMERIRSDDRIAFRILLERYWGPLVSYATSMVGLRDNGEDVAQEAFIRVWRHRSEWTPSGSVGAYLYRITRNLALNALRTSTAEAARREALGRDVPSSDAPGAPDQELARQTLRSEIEAAIASLPARRREVFVLSRFHGLTHAEIGEAMGTSPQTVANQMTSALAELRDRLSGHLRET